VVSDINKVASNWRSSTIPKKNQKKNILGASKTELVPVRSSGPHYKWIVTLMHAVNVFCELCKISYIARRTPLPERLRSGRSRPKRVDARVFPSLSLRVPICCMYLALLVLVLSKCSLLPFTCISPLWWCSQICRALLSTSIDSPAQAHVRELVSLQSVFNKFKVTPYCTGTVPLNSNASTIFYQSGNLDSKAAWVIRFAFDLIAKYCRRFINFAHPTDAQLENLVNACRPATFGMIQQDVYDEA